MTGSRIVVVGAGSAGSTVTRRLVEAGHAVVLVEAGPDVADGREHRREHRRERRREHRRVCRRRPSSTRSVNPDEPGVIFWPDESLVRTSGSTREVVESVVRRRSTP